MSLITQEQSITQFENINQNSLISDNNMEKTEQKLTESKIIEDKEITLPNSSDKKNSSNKIMQQPNLNNFIKKTYANDEEENDYKDKIDNSIKKINDFETKENYEKFEKLFLEKKRLMKKSDIILKKKLLRKLAKNYVEKEAELGSENEEHDDVVKKVYHSDSDSEKENDKNAQDIENLIDNEVNEDYDQNEKYFDDMLEKDHEEILKVIEGPKKRIIKEAPKKIMLDDNGLSLKVRMERMNDLNNLRDEEDENNEEYQFKNLENKLKELKKRENEEEMNEEIKEMIEDNNNKLIKQINIITGQQNKRFKQHMQENEAILKNVIMNEDEDSLNKKKTNNDMVVKGNGAATLANKKFKPFFGMGKFGNGKNSLLNHIKKEKINSNDNFNKKNSSNFHTNLNLNSNNNRNKFNGNLNNLINKK